MVRLRSKFRYIFFIFAFSIFAYRIPITKTAWLQAHSYNEHINMTASCQERRYCQGFPHCITLVQFIYPWWNIRMWKLSWLKWTRILFHSNFLGKPLRKYWDARQNERYRMKHNSNSKIRNHQRFITPPEGGSFRQLTVASTRREMLLRPEIHTVNREYFVSKILHAINFRVT